MQVGSVRSQTLSGLRISLAVCAALVAIGVFAPWLAYFGREWNGIEGGGILALAFAAMAIVGAIGGLVQQPRPRWAALLGFFGFLLVTIWGAVVVAVLIKVAKDDFGSIGFSSVQLKWGLWVYFLGGIAGLILSIVDLVRGAGANVAQGYFPSGIVINNNSNAQVGANDNRQASSHQTLADRGRARLGVLDGGRPRPDIAVSPGQALVVGRDSSASVVLSDPKASRRHAEISLEGTTWVVRDLGAMNPTRILSARGGEQAVGGSTRRLEHGQLAIGDSIITLYPVGR